MEYEHYFGLGIIVCFIAVAIFWAERPPHPTDDPTHPDHPKHPSHWWNWLE